MDDALNQSLQQVLRSTKGIEAILMLLRYSSALEVALFDREWCFIDGNEAFQQRYRPAKGTTRDDLFELLTDDDTTIDLSQNLVCVQEARDRKSHEQLDLYCFDLDEHFLLVHYAHHSEPSKMGEMVNFMTMELANTMRELRRKNAELNQANQLIQDLLNVDDLTGLYNRRYLSNRLVREISLADRQRLPLSLAFCDIDHFKDINDHYGHEVGDKVLQDFAGVLRDQTRLEDSCVRFGGEEFVIIMPALGIGNATMACERIRKICETGIVGHYDKQSTPRYTVSIGVAGFQSGMDDQKLIQSADELMYRAKRLGRNRIEISTALEPVPTIQ